MVQSYISHWLSKSQMQAYYHIWQIIVVVVVSFFFFHMAVKWILAKIGMACDKILRGLPPPPPVGIDKPLW